MNKAPFFSIIIPALNEEKYIPRLLRVLKQQTYTDFEVILVDGNSDDRTVDIAQKTVAEAFSFKVIISKQRNLPYQKNLGASKAKGSYFVFFDADAMVPRNFLEEIYKTIQTKHADFLSTWFQADSTNVSDQLIVTAINMAMELGKAIGKQHAQGPNTIISRKAFDKAHGYDESILLGEDFAFSQRVQKAGFDLYILKDPKAIMCLRRFRSQGRLQALGVQMEGLMQLLINGSDTKQMIHYPMGGHVHQSGPKRK